MSLPKEAWGWWGEEGGHRLEVKRGENGSMVFTVVGATQPPASVTIANFRVAQIKEWMSDEVTT